jgi:hypothetical protein
MLLPISPWRMPSRGTASGHDGLQEAVCFREPADLPTSVKDVLARFGPNADGARSTGTAVCRRASEATSRLASATVAHAPDRLRASPCDDRVVGSYGGVVSGRDRGAWTRAEASSLPAVAWRVSHSKRLTRRRSPACWSRPQVGSASSPSTTSWTYRTVAVISGKKPQCLASADLGVLSVISHLLKNRHYSVRMGGASPGWWGILAHKDPCRNVKRKFYRGMSGSGGLP